jgi:hypothetical protein
MYARHKRKLLLVLACINGTSSRHNVSFLTSTFAHFILNLTMPNLLYTKTVSSSQYNKNVYTLKAAEIDDLISMACTIRYSTMRAISSPPICLVNASPLNNKPELVDSINKAFARGPAQCLRNLLYE